MKSQNPKMELLTTNQANLTEIFNVFWNTLPPNVAEMISPMITLLKAIGIIFILYLIFATIEKIIILKIFKKINNIEKEINDINSKLNTSKKNKGKK